MTTRLLEVWHNNPQDINPKTAIQLPKIHELAERHRSGPWRGCSASAFKSNFNATVEKTYKLIATVQKLNQARQAKKAKEAKWVTTSSPELISSNSTTNSSNSSSSNSNSSNSSNYNTDIRSNNTTLNPSQIPTINPELTASIKAIVDEALHDFKKAQTEFLKDSIKKTMAEFFSRQKPNFCFALPAK